MTIDIFLHASIFLRLSRHTRALLSWCAVLMLSGVGSILLGRSGSGDTTDPVPLSPAQTFLSVRLDQHAVNLALTPPYDTVRLNPQLLNAAGSSLVGVTGRVRYSYPDSSVTADSTGLLDCTLRDRIHVCGSPHSRRRG